jgi:hypothetical protein
MQKFHFKNFMSISASFIQTSSAPRVLALKKLKFKASFMIFSKQLKGQAGTSTDARTFVLRFYMFKGLPRDGNG